MEWILDGSKSIPWIMSLHYRHKNSSEEHKATCLVMFDNHEEHWRNPKIADSYIDMINGIVSENKIIPESVIMVIQPAQKRAEDLSLFYERQYEASEPIEVEKRKHPIKIKVFH